MIPSVANSATDQAQRYFASSVNKFGSVERSPFESGKGRGVGCWRMASEGSPFSGLLQAMDAVERAWADRPDLRDLAVFLLPRLPGKPLASDSLKTDAPVSARLPMEDVVVRFPWMGMNTPEAVNAVWVESDRAGFRERVDRLVALGLPAPAWIAEGARGGHAAWVLRTPVVTLHGKPWRKGMLSLLRCTHSYLLTGLEGDRGAALRGMTKNPFCPRWTVSAGSLQVHDLKDLLHPLKAIAKAEGWPVPRRYDQMLDAGEGRNCALFQGLEAWARAEGVTDRNAIRARALEANAEFPEPLGEREALSVANSVARRIASGRVRMHVPMAPAEIARRQAEAGRRTAAGRKQAVAEKLERARMILEAKGEAVTGTALAGEAGVGRTTAWRHLNGYAVPDAPPPSGSSGDAVRPEAVLRPANVPMPVILGLVPHARGSVQGMEAADIVLPPTLAVTFTASPDELREGARAMTVAQRSMVARAERHRFYAEAAEAGPSAYVRRVLGRLGDLRRERAMILGPLAQTVEAMGGMLGRGEVSVVAAAGAVARLARARMGWASTMAAELRAAEKHHPRTPDQGGKRLWTMDDEVAGRCSGRALPSAWHRPVGRDAAGDGGTYGRGEAQGGDGQGDGAIGFEDGMDSAPP